MIQIDIFLAASVFLAIFFFAIFLTWLLEIVNERKAKNLKAGKVFFQCEYCSHVFFVDENKEIICCPLCKSYVNMIAHEAKSINGKDNK